jgi:hypothetical protein
VKLPGVKRFRVCLPRGSAYASSPRLRRDIATFARAWQEARAILARKGLSRLADGVNIAVTQGVHYYARQWKDDILCINLAAFVRQRDQAGILIHELGHRVYFRAMTTREQAAWHRDHLARRSARADSPTPYAAKDPLEDHAEVFRLRMQGRLHGAHLVRYVRLGPRTRVVRRRLARRAA